MAITRKDCLKIETLGLVVGWGYLVTFAISCLTAVIASFVGMTIYISAGDGVLAALLIFFIMVLSVVLLSLMCYITNDYIKGLKARNIPRVRRFKLLIILLLIISFAMLIVSIIGASQTFKFQKSWENSSTPPLHLAFVGLGIFIFSFHVGMLVIIDIVEKKFKTFELRNQIYKENLNMNVMAYPVRPKIHINIPEIDLPPPPKF